MRTRGEVLSSAISFALIGAVKVIRGLRKGLSNDERYAVADAAVSHLKKYGDPWKLNEEFPPPAGDTGHGMPASWQKPSTSSE
jgi:hypothetical protein